MAFRAKNGTRITNTKLKGFAKAIGSGKRSAIEIERTELGDLTGRGKSLTRIFEREGIVIPR